MKLGDLVPVFARAYWRCPQQDCEEAYEAGIRAVIAVLRDDLCDKVDQFDLDGRELANEFNGILASEGGQAAGAERVETLTSAVAQAETPATAPAPAVCVWVPQDEGPAHEIWKTGCGTMYERAKSTGWCSKCKAPIKFTEAK